MSEYDILINKYDALNAGYDQLYPKPMKHANTHASGGTDPITPGNIGAYSKNETDTLLANKAPAGYGLGASSKNVTDWNNEKTNGWVRDPSGTEDKHSPFVGLFSVGLVSDYYAGKDAFQLAFARNQFAKTRTYIKYRAYNSDDKVWGEWEWVNPPMELGVEYRTTERYLGKPVYVKAINFGVLTNASASSASFNVNQTVFRPIDFGGIAVKNDGSISYALTSHGNNISGNDIALNVFGSSAWIKTSGDYSDFTATVWVKYYKSTD